MRVPGSRVRRKAIRVLAVWFIIGLQAEMVWLGEFHRHAEEQSGIGGATFVERAAGQSTDAHHSPRCVACQIRLERAANLATANVPAAPASVRTLVPLIPSAFFSPLHFAAESPRAPPVG
ncbi:MAG: hypothetical protein HY508_12240 [Acidobacteria bacterium]|nr:hypothetical protein [Acidobacteriota bacterium]